MLTLSAPVFKETNEDGELNYTEPELIEKASNNYEEETGMKLNIEHLIERDDYGKPIEVKEKIFEPKKFTIKNEDGEEEKDEDDKAAENASAESSDNESSSGTCNLQQIEYDVQQEKEDIEKKSLENIQYKAEYSSQSITEVDQKIIDKLEDTDFHIKNNYYYENKEFGLFDRKEVGQMIKYTKDIEKALIGYNGKTKRINPAKRLSNKDICTDISDRIYIGRDYVNGKFIDQNLVIDGSGSMSGEPMNNAIKLAFIFNKLSQSGLLEGKIILTETSQNFVIDMPVADEVILSLGGTGGGEGLARTLDTHIDKLRHKNVVVVTDGDLVEEPIPDTFWDQHRINPLGVYVNESVKYEDLPGYDRNMSRWFPKSIIRNNFEDLVQKLIQVGLKASKK